MNPQNIPQQPEDQPHESFEQNTQPTTIFQVETPKPSQKKKILIATIIISAVLLVVTAVLMYIFMIILKDDNTVVTEEKKDVPATVVIDMIKDGILDEKEAPVIKEYSRSPAYQLDGYRYSSRHTDATGISYQYESPSVKVADMNKTVSDVFVSQGLIANGVYFTSKSLVCQMMNDISEENFIISGVVVCGEIAKYKEVSAALQPFADALVTLTNDSVLSDLVINESSYGGYKNAQLHIETTDTPQTAYFYKKDSSSRWLLLTQNADSMLKCALFSDIEMQRAYLETPCVDDAGRQVTVQVVQKRS